MKDKVVRSPVEVRGSGRAAALAFTRKGAKVVIAARSAERVHRLASKIEAAGGRALFVRADVSQAADVRGLVKTTVDCWGPLPLLTSCALSSCLKKWHSTRKSAETFPKAGAERA